MNRIYISGLMIALLTLFNTIFVSGITVPGTGLNTYLSFFQNDTEGANYLVFIGRDDDLQFLLTPKSSLNFDHFKSMREKLFLSSRILIYLKSLSDFHPSIYLQFGGAASGMCPEGYQGPLFVSLWKGHSDIPYSKRNYVSFCQKSAYGSLGIKIYPGGIPEIIAGKNTFLLSVKNTTHDVFEDQRKLASAYFGKSNIDITD